MLPLPYVPETTPQSPDSDQLTRYLANEFQKIGQLLGELLDGFVPPAYGGMKIDTVNLNTATTTPQVLTTWDTISPVLHVEPDDSAGELSTADGGVFYVSATLRLAVVVSTAYTLALYVDGSVTADIDDIDVSNANSVIEITLAGLVEVDPGAVMDLRFSTASGSKQFDVLAADWSVIKVGA